jgi:hypothetical protein
MIAPRPLAFAAALVLCSGFAHAGTLVYDGFETPGDYTAGNLESQTGGSSDWDSAWADNNNNDALLASTDSLTYNNLVTQDGSATTSGGTSNRVHYTRTFDTFNASANDPIWFSALLQRNAGTNGWNVQFGDVVDEQTHGFGFGHDNGNTDVQAVIQGSEGSTSTATAIVNDTTYFVVGRYIIDAGLTNPTHEVLDLWVNPDLHEDLASQPIGSGDSFLERSFSGTTFDTVNIYVHQNTEIKLDEIRLGTTQADVMPVPEPGSLALAASGVLLLAGRRRRVAA